MKIKELDPEMNVVRKNMKNLKLICLFKTTPGKQIKENLKLVCHPDFKASSEKQAGEYLNFFCHPELVSGSSPYVL